VGDPTQQEHDFEPGIATSGLFWTIPISPSAVSISPATGTARFTMQNVPVRDFFNFFNAISDNPSPPPVASHVSFDVRWQGGGPRQKVSDSTFDFGGEYTPGPVSISFTAAEDGGGVVYRSIADRQTTIGGGVGHERNGVFFP
jgi:hypothetical protein